MVKLVSTKTETTSFSSSLYWRVVRKDMSPITRTVQWRMGRTLRRVEEIKIPNPASSQTNISLDSIDWIVLSLSNFKSRLRREAWRVHAKKDKEFLRWVGRDFTIIKLGRNKQIVVVTQKTAGAWTGNVIDTQKYSDGGGKNQNISSPNNKLTNEKCRIN